MEKRFGASVWMAGSYNPDLNLVVAGIPNGAQLDRNTPEIESSVAEATLWVFTLPGKTA